MASGETGGTLRSPWQTAVFDRRACATCGGETKNVSTLTSQTPSTCQNVQALCCICTGRRAYGLSLRFSYTGSKVIRYVARGGGNEAMFIKVGHALPRMRTTPRCIMLAQYSAPHPRFKRSVSLVEDFVTLSIVLLW